jgi:hypothetical protein
MGKIISTPKSKGQLTKSISQNKYASPKRPKYKITMVPIQEIAHTANKPSWWGEHFKKH